MTQLELQTLMRVVKSRKGLRETKNRLRAVTRHEDLSFPYGREKLTLFTGTALPALLLGWDFVTERAEVST